MTPPPSALGEFEVIVLMAVLRCGDDAYGSAVRDEIDQRTSRRVARGAVYVTLDRLEDKSLLTSRTSESAPDRGGRPRRVYRVSAAGLRAVRQALADMASMRAGIEPLLGRP